MIDGPTAAIDLDSTEANRDHVRAFLGDVLIRGELEQLEHYVDRVGYTEHNPGIR